MTDLVKPFTLEQGCYPINNPVDHACHRTVNNYRACDGKHLRAKPITQPSAAANIGHSNLKNIYFKTAVWYNEIK